MKRLRRRPNSIFRTTAAVLVILWASGCARKPPVKTRVTPPSTEPVQARTGFSVQVGAFSNLDNAVRLARSLNEFGINAYYFRHESGLFKVRFGDFEDQRTARRQAERFRSQGIFQDFFIVSPQAHAVDKQPERGAGYVRDAIVQRAESYLGIPYRWGGVTPEDGFDCSGLTMAVYDLVGLKLPHSSHAQFAVGTPVRRRDLQRGDLVFFRTAGTPRVTHVGIFTGRGQFIHAPGKAKTIRKDSLSSDYFQRRYAGARSYLQ
jgi:hypothetical protein